MRSGILVATSDFGGIRFLAVLTPNRTEVFQSQILKRNFSAQQVRARSGGLALEWTLDSLALSYAFHIASAMFTSSGPVI
jgi:hypothetical protein